MQTQQFYQHGSKYPRERIGRGRAIAVATAALLALAGCTGEGTSSEAQEDDAVVTFALDWAPNTNHVGVYVAAELGFFTEADLEVEILPYASTPVPQLVSAGEADFGIGGQSGVQTARTAGLDVVSVYAITHSDTGRLVWLGDRTDLTRPADLDGLTFGGFGNPLLSAYVRTVITADGGTGEFTEVTLDTGAYEALSQGRIDFTLSVATWENLQRALEGSPYTEFSYQDYGLPDQQSTGIISSDAFLTADPDAARAFVQAVARGYAYAAEHPADAAQILIDANPDTLGTAEELVHRSLEALATDGFLVKEGHPTGAAIPEFWAEFGAFLLEHALLTDSAGNPVTEEPDWSEYYTNEFLP